MRGFAALMVVASLACAREKPRTIEAKRPAFPEQLLRCGQCPAELRHKPLWEDFRLHSDPDVIHDECFFCRYGGRCVQSLVDSDWVVLRDELGFEAYRWTPTSGWGRGTRITRLGEEAFKRTLPRDLARWVGELPELPEPPAGDVSEVVREYFGITPGEVRATPDGFGARVSLADREGDITFWSTRKPALLTGFGLPGCDGRAVTPQDGGTTRE